MQARQLSSNVLGRVRSVFRLRSHHQEESSKTAAPSMSVLEKGIFLAKSGNVEAAYAFLKAAAELEPENEDVWLWLSRTATNREESNAYFKRALELDRRQEVPSPNAGAASRGASAATRQMDHLETMRHYSAPAARAELASKATFQPVGRTAGPPARRVFPRFGLAVIVVVIVTVALYFGLAGLGVIRFPSAASQPAVALSSNSFAAGVTLYSQSKYAEAIPQFQKALEKDGQNGEVHLFLGLAYFQGPRQTSLAEGELQKAIALLKDPTNLSTAHYNLGIIREQQGRADLACQEYAEAVRLNPSNKQAGAAKNVLDKEGSCSR